MDVRGRPVRVPGLANWLCRVAPAAARGHVNIALVTDARMRALNRQFRKTDAPTDVLSFPDEPASKTPPSPRQLSNRARFAGGSGAARLSLTAKGPFLGDIVIARGVARRQARMAEHSELTELRILALHGLLHLLGYDHHGRSDAMGRLERRLRKAGGLPEGLIERAHRL